MNAQYQVFSASHKVANDLQNRIDKINLKNETILKQGNKLEKLKKEQTHLDIQIEQLILDGISN